VRDEVQAKPDEPLHIIEFLKPGLDEIAGMLPPSMSRSFHAWATRRGWEEKLSIGMHIKTNSVSGFLLLRAMAGMRFWRRRTARYAEEQAMIERWLAAIVAAVPRSPRLAFEIALTARLIKGYSDTHKRGRANFTRIFDTLVEGQAGAADDARADAIFAAREAALAEQVESMRGQLSRVRQELQDALKRDHSGAGESRSVADRRSRYGTVEEWIAGAVEHPGSWWPHWAAWLAEKSGKMVPARDPAKGPFAPLEDAPGSFVKVRS
jgi:hypothetical protein